MRNIRKAPKPRIENKPHLEAPLTLVDEEEEVHDNALIVKMHLAAFEDGWRASSRAPIGEDFFGRRRFFDVHAPSQVVIRSTK